MNLEALKKEAKSKKTSAVRLEELSRHPDTGVQNAVAGNENASAKTLEYLSGHGKYTILKSVAKNPNTPPAVLEKLAAHKQATVCAAAAGNPNTPMEVLEHLVTHPDPKVRLELTGRHAGAKIYARLADDPDFEVRELLAYREYCPLPVLKKLARDPESTVRARVAWGGKTRELVTLLATDPDYRVRENCVRPLHHFKEWGLLLQLSHDPSPMVRVEIAQLEPWRDELHAHLVADPESEVREHMARRDDLSEPVLRKLIQDPSPAVRRPLVYNKGKIPPFVLEALAQDPDENVRWQVAYNGSASKKLLERMSKEDSSKSVRETAAKTLERGF